MLPSPKIIKLRILDTPLEEPRRQPVLVYNARVDSSANEIAITSRKLTISELTADWTLFMDDLSSKMLDKISF